MKHKQMIDIEVGGFSRRLRYDFNAIASLEEAINRPVSAIGENVGVRELRAMLWAGLLHELPRLTLAQAGDMISFDKMEYITGKIQEAFALAMGQEQAEKN